MNLGFLQDLRYVHLNLPQTPAPDTFTATLTVSTIAEVVAG
ncbi:MAG: hypothetical protein NUW37_20045 [Planctomycetes bacterium]|nr:hypothetical protein [Planctomycetota bacterium]